ncbi:MAG: AAA family ATPase [Myxococcota bacterium]
MYTAFYGLREKPFALSPDPRFLYLAGSHREALAHLLYGIEQGEGFIAVTGEVGTGKTTLCRTLLERLDGDTELAFLFNPSRTALELMQSISAELGLPAEGLPRRALMTQLNEFLLERKREGRRVLLIIDEAQNLSDATLEQVRLLSNLETSREKLIQILLLGQPELDRKLDGRNLRQLRQRISVRWKLEPLAAHETRAYVRHRLAVAAGEPKEIFSESALREIHRRTAGIPRLVNQLCDRALLGGYAARSATIGARLVRAAAREIPDTRQVRRRRALEASRTLVGRDWMRPWMFVVASAALVVAALATGLQIGRTGLTDALRSALDRPSVPAGVAATPGAPPPVAAAPQVLVDDVALPESPPVARLLGYVPSEVAEVLSLKVPVDAEAALVDPSTPNGVSPAPPAPASTLQTADRSMPIPPRPEPSRDDAIRVTALAPGLLPRMLLNRAPADAIADSQRGLLDRFAQVAASSAAARAAVGSASWDAIASDASTAAGSPDRTRDPSDAEASFLARLRDARNAPVAADDRALESDLRASGLATTRFDGGSIGLLRQLDHPVLLPLVPSAEAAGRARARAAAGVGSDADAASRDRGVGDAEATDRWVAVLGFAEDRAYVAGLLEDRIATVPADELERHWRETGVIVWREFEALPPLLAPGDRGEGVRWLRAALGELDLLAAAAPATIDPAAPGATTATFDAATRAALVELQTRSGLVADGLAGPLTRIALYARLDRYPVPRLSTPPQTSFAGLAPGAGATWTGASKSPTQAATNATSPQPAPAPGDRG